MPSSPLHIVVTGKSGQLVSALREAAGRNDAVRFTSIGMPEIDLARPDGIAAVIASLKPDLVVNAAAYTAVDKAEDEPELANAINAVAAGEVARGAALSGAPVVQISTDYVFDGNAAGAMTEAMAVNPVSVYGRTKLEGERRAIEVNPGCHVIRTAWVFSPWGKNFVLTMVNVARTRNTFNVVDDQFGCPTSAIDLADAILAAAPRIIADPSSTAGIYHLAGTGVTNWYGFAQTIFELAAERSLPSAIVLPIATSGYPTKAARPANSRLDSSRFQHTFGFSMPHWRVSLAHVLDRLAEEGMQV